MTEPATVLNAPQRRRKYGQQALSVTALAAVALVASLFSSWQAASADPGSGRGPLTVELTATNDAYIQGTRAINNGELRVESGSRTRTSYVQFDLSNVDASASGELRLTVGSDEGRSALSVWSASDTNWTQDTLSTQNAPTPGDLISTVDGPFFTGTEILIPMPDGSLVGDTLQIILTTTATGSDDFSFAATEGGNGPTLILDTQPSSDVNDTDETDAPEPDTTNDPDVTQDPGSTQTVSFDGTTANVPNPERGFHEGASVRDSTGGSNSSVAALTADYNAGLRVSRMYIRLDDYRNAPVPQQLIDDLDELFENARQSGMKIIPRFAYNFGDGGDARVEQIEAHLEQLTPVIQRNSDVIAVLQAGFIGKWGEWHGSTNGVDSVENQQRVRNALLDALPVDRMAQFRYPADIIEFEPTPLTSADAWSGSDASRTAHKNDCFLANEGDAGTYNPLSQKSEMQQYLETMTAFAATGGETCQVSAGNQRTDCVTALEELDRFNWDYLNLGFYGNTIDKWRTDGCFDEIESRLGYRYEMLAATVSTNVQRGTALNVDLDVNNVGFGKLYNPRPLNIVLVNDETGAMTRVQSVADARTVLPLSGDAASLELAITVPPSIDAGNYSVHIELPDGSASLANDPRYSIQMANAGTWVAASGTNDLGVDVTITN